MVHSASRPALRSISPEELATTCRTEKCSKLCTHLGYNAPRSRTQSFTLAESKSSHEKESIIQNPSRCAHNNAKEDETEQLKCTPDETPFRLDSPDIASASAYATPCGKEYSFVLTGTLDPDVYKLCTLMYRKYLLDWVNDKLSLFPEPFPPKMENLSDESFPSFDGQVEEDFYWNEPVVRTVKPMEKKPENAHVIIFVAFLLGAILKRLAARWPWNWVFFKTQWVSHGLK